jgi:predicted nuclease of predicted toxin-antitoxin system
MIIFDENLEAYWIELIKGKGYDTFSIKENNPGISDREVLDIVKNFVGLLITEDKDFGELIESYVLKSIESYFNDPDTCFITVTKNKIRTRRI